MVDPAECGDERLDGEGEAVEHGADKQAGEGEGQGMAQKPGNDAACGREWTEADEQIEAEDRRWQHQWKGNERFHKKTKAGAPEGKEIRHREGNEEQSESGDGGETQGKEKSFDVQKRLPPRCDSIRLKTHSRSQAKVRRLVNALQPELGKMKLDFVADDVVEQDVRFVTAW